MCNPTCKTYTNCNGQLKKDDADWILNPTKMPFNLREFVDYDYIKHLSACEKTWLRHVTDAHYTGKRNDVSKDWSKEEFNVAFNANNARLRDVYNQCFRSGNVDVFATKHIAKAKSQKTKE